MFVVNVYEDGPCATKPYKTAASVRRIQHPGNAMTFRANIKPTTIDPAQEGHFVSEKFISNLSIRECQVAEEALKSFGLIQALREF